MPDQANAACLRARQIRITESHREVDTAVPIGIGAPVAPCFHYHTVRLDDELNHAAHVYAKHQGIKVETLMAEALRAYLHMDR